MREIVWFYFRPASIHASTVVASKKYGVSHFGSERGERGWPLALRRRHVESSSRLSPATHDSSATEHYGVSRRVDIKCHWDPQTGQGCSKFQSISFLKFSASKDTAVAARLAAGQHRRASWIRIARTRGPLEILRRAHSYAHQPLGCAKLSNFQISPPCAPCAR